MGSTPEIIAEIGTAHGGDPALRDELISAAAESGADTCKFQWVIADEIVHPATGLVALPGGETRLYDRFRALECSPDFYADAKAACDAAGVGFLCSVFGAESATALSRLSSAVKIASPELNHTPLLLLCSQLFERAILSAGVATREDIDEAMTHLETPERSLLHCVTAYPAPPEDYNLRVIPPLAAELGVPVGVSDHTLDPLLVPCLAAAIGAVIIEKHITLSRSGPGLDDPVALEPAAFAQMSRAVRALMESPPPARLPWCAAEFGPERCEAVLGDGRKRLAPSEVANYGRTNRSIHAVRDLASGHRLTADDFAVLRTERVLRPGLHPREAATLAGRTLRAAVPAGEGIRESDLESAVPRPGS